MATAVGTLEIQQLTIRDTPERRSPVLDMLRRDHFAQAALVAIDVMLAFPYILLAIALVAALGPGLTNAMIAIAIANVSFYARNVRGNVLALRNQPFVEAALSAGGSHVQILARHILPNTFASIL